MFYFRTHLNSMRVNKIEAMYEVSRVNVKIMRGSNWYVRKNYATV